MASLPIHHDEAAGTFTLRLEGELARLDYQRSDGRMRITRTFVPDAIGGRGIAGQLMQAASEYAANAGLGIDPQCSYAAAWLARQSRS